MRKALTALLLFSCGGWYIYANVMRPWAAVDGTQSDFGHHYRAAQKIVAGNSPFLDPGYDYPPLAALAATSLTGVSYAAAQKIWFALSNIFLLLAAWLTWRAAGRGWMAACCVAVVWALGDAALENLLLGQLGPLLVLLLAIAYTSGSMTSGAAIAAGFALKFIPGVLGFPLLLARDRRAVATLIATGGSLVAISWGIVICCLAGPKGPASAHYWMGTPAVLSWSLPSTFLRMVDPPVHGIDMPAKWLTGNDPSLVLPEEQRFVSVGIALITLLCGALALGRSCRWYLDRSQLPWGMAAMISLSLAASPICWTHYQVMQYPGMALLLAASIRERRWAMASFTLGFGALLYPLPVAVLRAYYNHYGAWTAASPATLYFWTSITPVACLGLFGILVVRIRSGCTTS